MAKTCPACPKCGGELTDPGATTCPHCGAALGRLFDPDNIPDPDLAAGLEVFGIKRADGSLVSWSFVPVDWDAATNSVLHVLRHPGKTDPQRFAKAAPLFAKAAAKKDASPIAHYASALVRICKAWMPKGVFAGKTPPLPQGVMDDLGAAADGGITEARHLYAWLAWRGLGNPSKKAACTPGAYLRLAAEAGHADSECLLGFLLIYEDSPKYIEKNPGPIVTGPGLDESGGHDERYWLERAVSHGCREAEVPWGVRLVYDDQEELAHEHFERVSDLPSANYWMALIQPKGKPWAACIANMEKAYASYPKNTTIPVLLADYYASRDFKLGCKYIQDAFDRGAAGSSTFTKVAARYISAGYTIKGYRMSDWTREGMAQREAAEKRAAQRARKAAESAAEGAQGAVGSGSSSDSNTLRATGVFAGAASAKSGAGASSQASSPSEAFDLEAALADVVGLEDVKEFLRNQQKVLKTRKKREAAGDAAQAQAPEELNMVFAGPPGTGKTMMARLTARMLKEMGYLSKGDLVEVSRSDLVSEYKGQTAKETKRLFESALGGVLVIDEAYALIEGEKDEYGNEAVNELTKCMGDHPGEAVVIMTGYREKMEAFFRRANPGLASRFPKGAWVEFTDYTDGQLVEIAEKLFARDGRTLTDGARELLPAQLAAHIRKNASGKNARAAGRFVNDVERRQDVRIADEDLDGDALSIITKADMAVVEPRQANKGFDLDAQFEKFVGMEGIKEQLRQIQVSIEMEEVYRQNGIDVPETRAPHMVFTGNPGTGKTTVAKVVARMLHALGAIESDRFVETKREDLVAGHVGQTGPKALEKFKEALGGVLFVDEAYRLHGAGENDFGHEAAEALMQFAEENRDTTVVILAGYAEEMDRFFDEVNPGMRSRFANIIDFPDYTPDELVAIACLNCGDFMVSDTAKERMREVFEQASKEKGFGNGRYARNLAAKALGNKDRRLHGRVAAGDMPTKEELMTVEPEDVEPV